jgi:hypothetical protein
MSENILNKIILGINIKKGSLNYLPFILFVSLDGHISTLGTSDAYFKNGGLFYIYPIIFFKIEFS